jgi:dolichyl-phosphate-mannose--protein O-mannosyl transferase
VPESFVWTFLRLNKEMFVTNAAISTTHAWSSTIPQWIFDLKGVLYFSLQAGEEDLFSNVYLLGNPFVLWGAFAAVLLASFGMIGSAAVEEMKHRIARVGCLVSVWSVRVVFRYRHFSVGICARAVGTSGSEEAGKKVVWHLEMRL